MNRYTMSAEYLIYSHEDNKDDFVVENHSIDIDEYMHLYTMEIDKMID